MGAVLTSVAPVLVVVDAQRAFENADYWGLRDNPECERNIRRLLDLWREKEWPVVFVKHDSDNPASVFATGTPGNEFMDVITGDPDLLVHKKVNSAFHGSPDLNAWLRDNGISEVVICGITTNHCCETTARLSGNLGYDTYFVIDATHTFDRTAPDGSVVPTSTLSFITATNLDGEFATVVNTADLMAD